MQRRELLQQREGIGLEVIGPRSSDRTRQIVEFARRNRIPHTWRDPEHTHDRDAAALIEALEPQELPLVRLPGGTDLRGPSSGDGVARARHRPRARAARGGRPRRRRRRAGRSRRRRLRRVGGPGHARRRGHRARRPGRRVAADRELPRVPGRHRRLGAHEPRRHPGAQVRRPHRDALPRRRRSSRATAATSCASRRTTRSPHARSCWRPAPSTGAFRSTGSRSTRASRSSTPPGRPRRRAARARASASSAAATRRRRRPSGSRAAARS